MTVASGILHRFVRAALVLGTLTLSFETAHAEDIRGTIVRTLILSEDARLVGDVTCTVEGAACIAFGATRNHAVSQRLRR